MSPFRQMISCDAVMDLCRKRIALSKNIFATHTNEDLVGFNPDHDQTTDSLYGEQPINSRFFIFRYGKILGYYCP